MSIKVESPIDLSMADSTEFDLLLIAARSGDADALGRLVAKYEPELRLVARLRLGAALRPHLDSVDLVQSVHRSLLIGLRADRFDISSPEKLIALALTIVRRKVAKHWRHLKRQQRLSGVEEASDDLVDTLLALRSSEPTVSESSGLREHIQRLMLELDPIEKQLIAMRIDGFSTIEVARELGLDPDVLRVKLSRVRKRLREKGFEDELL